jgi:hypothetical protein
LEQHTLCLLVGPRSLSLSRALSVGLIYDPLPGFS